jgi:transcriptional regulator GlxA family with amidase domain
MARLLFAGAYEIGQNRRVAGKTSFVGFKPSRRGSSRTRRRHLVVVVAFDGVVLGDLATPCEIFGRVDNEGAHNPYDVRICAIRSVVKSEHVALKVRWRLSLLSRADTVIVPGLDDINRPVPRQLIDAIRRAVHRGTRVASICSGAFILAAAGVLDGSRATTHWRGAPELARRYPKIRVDPGVLYVDNGSVLTSAGAAAGLDLCIHLVRRDLGADRAAAVARAAVMPLERAGGQAQFIVHEPPAPNGLSMGPLLRWIEENLRAELSLSVLARRAAMSTRTLSRRFREQVGTTPALWVTRARVRLAQRLLETTELSVEAVATHVGFGSATVLRDRFGGIVGTSPMAYRRSFKVAG